MKINEEGRQKVIFADLFHFVQTVSIN